MSGLRSLRAMMPDEPIMPGNAVSVPLQGSMRTVGSVVFQKRRWVEMTGEDRKGLAAQRFNGLEWDPIRGVPLSCWPAILTGRSSHQERRGFSYRFRLASGRRAAVFSVTDLP